MALPSTLGVTLGYGDSDIWRNFIHHMTQYTIWSDYLLNMDDYCILENLNNIYKKLNQEKSEKLEKYFMESEITKPKNIVYISCLKEKEEIKEILKLKLEKITENDFDYFNKNI